MKNKKFYAVKVGYNPGIYSSWDECEKNTKGFPKAQYQSFFTYEEAEAYINDIDLSKKVIDESINDNKLIAYVGGSWNNEIKLYSYGCVIIQPNGEVFQTNSVDNNPEAVLSKNIAGELEGTMYSIKWAIDNGYNSILIRHNLEHTSSFANGKYKPKINIAKEYVDFINEKSKIININFEKVKGHSGDKYNNLADKLAKDALIDVKGKKITKSGEQYTFIVEGINFEEIETIIELIKEIPEYNNLGIQQSISNSTTQIQMKLKKENITIHYYPNRGKKLMVQGKPKTLFTIFTTYVIELIETDKIPEIFNNFHKLDIQAKEIQAKYEEYLPDIDNNFITDKMKKALNQACYNLNIYDNMPEPNQLVYPSLRVTEGFLKLILNKYQIPYNGDFDMFEKNNYKFTLKHTSRGTLNNSDIEDYLGSLYTFYNKHRHTLFHWDDITNNVQIDTTRMINNVHDAHTIIIENLNLLNHYFVL